MSADFLDEQRALIEPQGALAEATSTGARIKVTLDKSETSIDALLASLLDRSALLPLHAVKETK
jgi:hypothetical protein